MKFLVIAKGNFAAHPEVALRLIEPQKEFLRRGLSSGLLDCAYAIPGLPGGMVIANCDSLEGLQDLLQDYPYGAFLDYTVYPLADVVRAIDRAAELTRKLSQMM